VIKMPLQEEFWLVDGLKHLEKIRSGIRNLLKYIDPVDQRYVTTDFEDELDETKIVIREHYALNEAPEVYSNPFANNIHRLEELLRENKEHITISRIRKGETITKKELKALEEMLWSNDLSKDELEKEMGQKLNLTQLIVSLMGLSAESVDKAFSEFINQHSLTSVQIKFLDTIKLFMTKNGKIDPEKLYDSPFKEYHSMGIDGVFNEQQADKIFQIITQLNQTDKGA
jgi:type I restriction enzyme R subunit